MGHTNRSRPWTPFAPLARLTSVISPGAAHATCPDNATSTTPTARQTLRRNAVIDRQPDPHCTPVLLTATSQPSLYNGVEQNK